VQLLEAACALCTALSLHTTLRECFKHVDVARWFASPPRQARRHAPRSTSPSKVPLVDSAYLSVQEPYKLSRHKALQCCRMKKTGHAEHAESL
jgi:hypothetical protein